jgi:acyl-CoA thioester hydrolase
MGDSTSGETGILTYRGAVYPWDCDHMGHMNIAAYVAKFDEANWNLFFAAGITPSYLRSERFGMAGVQQNIAYKLEVFAGDVIDVRSSLLEVRTNRLRFRHDMRNIETGEIAAHCEITAVHMDKVQRKACPFPPAILQVAERLLAAGR